MHQDFSLEPHKILVLSRIRKHCLTQLFHVCKLFFRESDVERETFHLNLHVICMIRAETDPVSTRNVEVHEVHGVLAVAAHDTLVLPIALLGGTSRTSGDSLYLDSPLFGYFDHGLLPPDESDESLSTVHADVEEARIVEEELLQVEDRLPSDPSMTFQGTKSVRDPLGQSKVYSFSCTRDV